MDGEHDDSSDQHGKSQHGKRQRGKATNSDADGGKPRRTGARARSRGRVGAKRYFIDYVGGGAYHLALQEFGQLPKSIATGDDPLPLFNFAMEAGDAGDEVAMSPTVAMIQVTGLPTALLAVMKAVGSDPFNATEFVARVPSAAERDAAEKSLRAALERDQSGEPETERPGRSAAAGVQEGAEPARGSANPSGNASGGRIGWLFTGRNSESKRDRAREDGQADDGHDGADGSPPEID